MDDKLVRFCCENNYTFDHYILVDYIASDYRWQNWLSCDQFSYGSTHKFSFRGNLNKNTVTSPWTLFGFMRINIKPKKLAIFEIFLVLSMHMRTEKLKVAVVEI